MEIKVAKLDEEIIEVTVRGTLEEVARIIPGTQIGDLAKKEYYCVECSFGPSQTIYSTEQDKAIDASGACVDSGGFYKNITKGKCPT